MMKKLILQPVASASGAFLLFCLILAGGLATTRGANLPPTLNAITDRTILCGGSLALTNTASDAETPLNQLLFSLVNPLCATSSLPVSSYNIGPGLQAWRSHLDDTNVINVLLVGESTTEGLFASDIEATSYTAILRRRLQNVLGDGGLGLIPLYRELPPFTSHWNNQGNGWTQGRFDEYGPFSFTYFAANRDTYAEITIFGDNADVFLVLSPFGTNGPTGPYWQTDNGPTNYFNSYATNFQQSTLNISLGAPGWHTLRLTGPSAPGKSFGLWGASANLGQRGVRVHNAGKNGEPVGKAATPNARQFIGRLNPRLTVIAFSSNDYAVQTDTNAFRDRVLALIQEAQQTGSALLLGANPRKADTPTPIAQTTYHEILKNLAFSQNCAYIDMNERWGGSPASVRALGFSIDMVHPTDLGYADMGNHLYCQIAEQPVSETFFSSALQPDGLFLNGHTGLLQWKPSTNQCPSTNLVGVVVKDNGVPSLSTTQFFNVTVSLTNTVVVPQPVITAIRRTNTTATVIWSAQPGATYQLLFKSAITQANWTPVSGSIIATGTNASKADDFGSAPQRFYRVSSP
jgi:lysophospholipase L1-like esterase